MRPGGYTEKVIRQLILNLLGRHAPGIEIGSNAIPGMKIRPRKVSEGPLRMSLRLVVNRDETEDGQTRDCYATAA